MLWLCECYISVNFSQVSLYVYIELVVYVQKYVILVLLLVGVDCVADKSKLE